MGPLNYYCKVTSINTCYLLGKTFYEKLHNPIKSCRGEKSCIHDHFKNQGYDTKSKGVKKRIDNLASIGKKGAISNTEFLFAGIIG